MLAEFKTHIKSNFPELLEHRFLLGCSGGVDSVVMFHLCHRLNLDFEVAHCNFNLRGKESDADEKFVTELVEKSRIKLHVTIFDTIGYVDTNKVNVQVAARELRYTWFAEIMRDSNIPTLVTGHHADDNLETFIINLSRGTGIDGLTGIPSKTDTISRPLLAFSRVQILDYAKSENLKWVEDKSNADVKYLRNKIRHEILPVLKELHPTFLNNFEKTQSHLKGTNAILDNHIKLLKSRIFESHNGGFRISIAEIEVLSPQNAYLHALLKDYGFTAWDAIERLLEGISGKEVRSKTHRLLKDRGYLLLEKLNVELVNNYSIITDQQEIKEPIKMIVQEVESIEDTSENILYVDKNSLKYPLTVRKWKKGDYFYPFGMNGKKKLSKYFKDEKIDVISKEKQWLLCSENAIVWVIGRRSDQRFSITEKTTEIVKFILPQ